ncbi:MAG: alpha/beta hydrolase [Thermoleophilaceae bacterium]|nr:alpha/beta hydrolase [Thermoleophilaceae bacterium]
MSIAGVNTQVLESGPKGSGEAVVFLHGVLGSSQDFVDLLPRVGAGGQRAIAFDLPGYGRARPAWDFPAGFPGYTRWFGNALRKLGVRRAHLVLHDIGGPIALRWAVAHPRRTGRIALIDSGVLLGFVPHQIHVTWATPGVGEAFQLSLTRKVFEDVLAPQPGERALPRPFLARVYDDLDRETRCAVLRFFRSAAATALDPTLTAAQAARLRRTFGSRLPVLVVWGQKDVFLRVQMANRQREAFPSARVRVLRRSGHWPFADDPRSVRRLVMPFLSRIDDGSRRRR